SFKTFGLFFSIIYGIYNIKAIFNSSEACKFIKPKSWINLGFMNLQASELLKIALILYITYMIEKKRPKVFKNPKLMTSPIILSAICIGLVFLQRDVGQTLLILIIFFSILFYAGIGVQKSLKYGLIVLTGVGLIGGLFL